MGVRDSGCVGRAAAKIEEAAERDDSPDEDDRGARGLDEPDQDVDDRDQGVLGEHVVHAGMVAVERASGPG